MAIVLAGLVASPAGSAQDPDRVPDYVLVSGLSGTLTSMGSDTLGEMMELWQEAFRRLYPAVNLEYEAKGSGTAPVALLRGTAQLGLMSRQMLPAERARFTARFGYPPLRVTVARDALALFVHRSNPLDLLTLEEVDALFSANAACGADRAILRWGELGLPGGWADRRVTLYGRHAASGTYAYFKRAALCEGDFSPRVNEFGGGAAVVDAVAGDARGLGYGPVALLDGRVRALDLSPDGETREEPTEASITRGVYPFVRDLYVYVNRGPHEELDPLAREFLLFVLSSEGQAIVESVGYFPVGARDLLSERGEILGPKSLESGGS